jgi:hypothetical protein
VIPDGYIIDWAAWATFSTGVLAVGAALFVGVRQSRIGQRQTDILAQQVEISDRIAATEEARVRLELFQKRYEFVQTYNLFIKRVRAKRDDFSEEDTAFLEGAKEAEFLFPRALKGLIDELWTLAIYYLDAGADLANPDEKVAEAARKKRVEVRAKIDEAAKKFDELCDRAMRPFDD